MSESGPDHPAASAGGFGESSPRASTAPGDPLAARLLAAQQAIAALSPDSEARVRLNSRFMAICTALKMPGASRIRCIRRLNELMAEAEQVRASNNTSRYNDV